MPKINVKILGTGAYLPDHPISSEELEKTLGFAPGTIDKTSGVKKRYHAAGETASEMGAKAALQAVETSGISWDQIDAVVCVSGVAQQAIPCTAALIHQKLGLTKGVAFDMNSSCLSFLTGLECMGNLISQGVYQHVLLVSSDMASRGLNPKDPKTASLFGDGAAAAVVGPSEKEGIVASHFEMKSDHVHDCECKGGGTLKTAKKQSYFRMDGPRLYKAVLPPVLRMIRSFIKQAGEKIDLYIPHQASPFALDLLQKKLPLANEKMVHIVREYGNMVAASLPFALHHAIQTERLKRGDRVLLFGTGAGLTIGGVLLDY